MTTHNEVAHAWANQTGKHRRGHNMSYDGYSLISYGTIIARIIYRPVNNKDEGYERCVLITNRHYSVSTSKHVSCARRAVSNDRVFDVDDVGSGWAAPNHQRNLEAPNHQRNLEAMIANVIESIRKGKRARHSGPFYLDMADKHLQSALNYQHWFDLAEPAPEHSFLILQKEIDEARGPAQEKADKFNQQYAERRRLADERRVIEQREQERKQRDTLLKWLRGEAVQPPHTVRPYVRVKDDKVETSWGASAPLEQALNVYYLAKSCREGGTAYDDWDEKNPIQVGDFRVNSIDKVGTARIGCHVIGYRVMHMAAKRAGIAV